MGGEMSKLDNKRKIALGVIILIGIVCFLGGLSSQGSKVSASSTQVTTTSNTVNSDNAVAAVPAATDTMAAAALTTANSEVPAAAPEANAPTSVSDIIAAVTPTKTPEVA